MLKIRNTVFGCRINVFSSSRMCSIKNRASAEKVVEDVAEAPAEGAGEGIVVGVVMPTKSLQRWNQDGSNMKEQLEAKGFEVDLLFLHLVGLSIY